VRSQRTEPDADLSAQREVVDAFMAASREGDFERLVALLDPDVVLHADFGPNTPLQEVRGRDQVLARAKMYARLSLEYRPALVNGAVGGVALRDGQPFSVGAFTIKDGKIVEMDFLTDPARLAALDLTVVGVD
jgi:RNA polymerase sigma-70 factor (ECF subfamily)